MITIEIINYLMLTSLQQKRKFGLTINVLPRWVLKLYQKPDLYALPLGVEKITEVLSSVLSLQGWKVCSKLS